jgi:hypothetical protein
MPQPAVAGDSDDTVTCTASEPEAPPPQAPPAPPATRLIQTPRRALNLSILNCNAAAGPGRGGGPGPGRPAAGTQWPAGPGSQREAITMGDLPWNWSPVAGESIAPSRSFDTVIIVTCD